MKEKVEAGDGRKGEKGKKEEEKEDVVSKLNSSEEAIGQAVVESEPKI